MSNGYKRKVKKSLIPTCNIMGVNIAAINMEWLVEYLEENIALKKSKEDIPVTGMAVLRQQYTLAEAIEEWIASLKKEINS